MKQQWWCPKCNRTYLEGQQRGAKPMRLCSYNDCNCVADFSQISWASLRALDPSLVENPLEGQVFNFSSSVMRQAWSPAVAPTRPTIHFSF